jgi:undecaprenyl-diphosphatase
MPRVRFGRAEAVVLACWLALAAVFATMCFWARRTYFWPGDLRMSIWVQDWQWAEGVFKGANTLGDLELIIPVLLAMIVACALRRMWLEAAILASAGGMYWVHMAVKRVVDRTQANPDPPPPPELYPNSGSFPSGHVMGELLVYGLLFVLAPRLIPNRRIAAVVQVLCVAEIVVGAPARMYHGAHWPSDLYGAAALALLYLVPAVWLLHAWRAAEAPSKREERVESVPELSADASRS